MADHELIEQFVAVTSAPKHLAEQFLARNDDNLVDAIEDYYANEQPAAAGTSHLGGGRPLQAQRYVHISTIK